MVAENHYRWDFIGLSTDTKPTPADSEKVTDGSTYYTSDDSKLYVWYKDQWYEKEVEGGGGGTSYTAGDGIDITNHTISVDTDTIQEKLTAGTNITIDNNVISATGGGSVTPVQTTGTSTTDVMSQNATTSMVYADPGTNTKIKIGDGAFATLGDSAIEIGRDSKATSMSSVAIGYGATASGAYSVKIGTTGTASGEQSIALGYDTYSTGPKSVALGRGSNAGHEFSVALGAGATTSSQGEINVGTGSIYTTKGYNNTNYRLISGVHDPVNAHDAATKGYVDANAGGAVTELTADDYDVTIANVEGIALWRLPAGLYHTPNNVQAFAGNDSDFKLSLLSHFIIINDDGNSKLIKVIGDNFTSSTSGVYKGFVQYSVDSSTGNGGFYTNSISVITSDNLLRRSSSVPTSSDISFLGALRYNNSTGKLYINVNGPADFTGNWKEIQLVS